MVIQKPLVGFHASISGGLHKALEEAASLNCPTLQLFTKNNRTWNEPIITSEAISQFKSTRKALGIKIVTSHASYLINLASARSDVRHRSLHALKEEMRRSSSLEIDYVVLHPGSHTGISLHEGINYLAENCNLVLENNYSTMLLLETMAGQGSSIGRSFEEFALILEKIEHKNRIGFCLDTCHIFAGGYPVNTDEDYRNLLIKFETIGGLNKLKTIHINDSKKDLGSFVDRHEHLGKGKININFFKNIMNDVRLTQVPKILETPKESPDDNARNIQFLLDLIKNR